jgi:hypothetical protein
MALQIDFGWGAAEDQGVGVNERQLLPCLDVNPGAEGGDKRRASVKPHNRWGQ